MARISDLIRYAFADRSRHGGGGNTFKGRAPKNAKAADRFAAAFEARGRARERGRR